MTSSEIRASYLDFFARNGHRVVASSPLVPANDPTLLFTNAGMNQFKDVFLGRERREYTRAASSQKCMRVSGKHNDLENVGPSPRHHTFFEMLGNFSFGDYFKTDAIAFAWTLLTEVWQLPPERLHATIFRHWDKVPQVPRDEDAHAIWRKYLPAERISELGEDNFWAMGDTGPCGRCSEVHYFRGDHLPCPEPVCLGVACSCDRYVEIWNNVFMEFDRQPDGTLNPLPAPSIDTGMGLERITAVLQGVLSNYDTDLFTPLLGAIGALAGARYGGSMEPRDVSMRVIADHARAATFLIADGVVPSNEFRGYTLRRIMRRAMTHGKHLGMTEPFLHRLVAVLAGEMGDAYPELREQREYVERMIHAEEERFESVLRIGLPKLEDSLERAAAAGGVLAGDEAFRLYDTFGVPRDFIEDMAGQRGVAVDRAGFERAMEGQKEKARARHAFGLATAGSAALEAATETLRGRPDQFEGYRTTRLDNLAVIALLDEDGRPVPELREGQGGYLALDRTPFYAEAGGQVSDTGAITSTSGARARVEGLVRVGADRPRLHEVVVESGTISDRDTLVAEVDEELRNATRRNHTATHLLHAALRQVLGSHVKQAGSLVAPDRLRFDFVNPDPVTSEQLAEIERLVNAEILRNTPVETEVRATEEAIAAGAMALFGEKYGDRVRVVSVPGFSQELCGGTHVAATGDIGCFVIVHESGVAAGQRRIEALTGHGALQFYREQRRTLAGVLEALKVPADQAAGAIERLQADLKRLSRENSQLKVQLATASLAGAPATAATPAGQADAGGITLVARRVQGLDKAGLGQMADSLKNQVKSGVVVLASENDGRVAIVVSVTKDLVPKIHAGQIVKRLAPMVGGGGGGRPDFAEAGGKDPSGIERMLEEARGVVEEMRRG
ncbi:MAG TPA: alanine--tRNA ligase [Vicinamibacterales bacterium]|nr:alanine--tRNA ligase [Acidobacteriota bacterium]HOC16878.1 alanine--tRNA ligase [Vicinamibacterales bacterium]